ncbi:AT-rich interactive domain-containing protein 1 [Silene latifolia]|uniref:AT-rich interactive domain-containing protein 1 n=1 Tax=Silene latifolia TaxID=37657 RepID=UPI003D789F93
MAGWSKFEVSSCVNGINPCSEGLKSCESELHCYFVGLVYGYLKGCFGNDCFRPLPPRLGNGECIDLLKLYFVVKERGGFEAISEKNLWGEVSLQCGLGSCFGSAFKLIYDKYLSSLENWLVKLDKGSDLLMELERDYRAYASKFMDVERGSDDDSCGFKLEKSGLSFDGLMDLDDENGNENESETEKLDWKKVVADFADSEGSNEGNDDEPVELEKQNFSMDSANNDGGIGKEDNGDENLKRVRSEMSCIDGNSSDRSDNKKFIARPVVASNVVMSSENSDASKKDSTKCKRDMMNVDSGVSKEVSSNKRKQDCFAGVLQWMINVAKDPTDPVIGEIPECSKWASYGNDKNWKQALLARDSLFFRKIRAHSPYQIGSQKKLKRHLSNLYEMGGNYSRPRQRLEARLDMQPTSPIYTSRPQQRIPLGKAFQVQVPEWTGVTINSDPKWLGSQTWPLEKTENLSLIERDPIGKGRRDNCGCQFPGSNECVKFHVSEKRLKIRYELGSAFYAWNFDKMGEDCSVAWTIDEEKKFISIVKDNPQSLQKCFWVPMCEALPKKKWADQVNYYYNVFMLRRRGYQNRHYPSDIDSGDDETDYRSTNNSLRYGS